MRSRCFAAFDALLTISLCGLVFAIPISKAGTELFFYISFLFFIAKKTAKPDFNFLKDRLYIFLSLLFCFSALSIINSAPYQEVSLRALYLKWLKNLLIFVMFQDALTEKKRIHYVFFVFLVTSVFVGLDGIIQRGLGFDLFWRHLLMHLNNGTPALTATFTHYNGFGSYLIFPLSLVLALLIQKEMTTASRVGFYLLAVLWGGCLLLTFSRGAWLGFLGTLFFMLFLTKHVRMTAVFLIFFLTFILAIPFFRDRFLAIFLHGGDSDRFIYWKASWVMIQENPFLGKGVGTFMQRCLHYAPNVYVHYAHNCFLQIWAEAGLFSLLSFCGFLWLLFLRGIKIFRKNKDHYLLGVLCGLFGFLVHSFFDTQLYSLNLSALFWSMAGILTALVHIPIQQKENK